VLVHLLLTSYNLGYSNRLLNYESVTFILQSLFKSDLLPLEAIHAPLVKSIGGARRVKGQVDIRQQAAEFIFLHHCECHITHYHLFSSSWFAIPCRVRPEVGRKRCCSAELSEVYSLRTAICGSLNWWMYTIAIAMVTVCIGGGWRYLVNPFDRLRLNCNVLGQIRTSSIPAYAVA
jgi:hypothetical protein